MFKKRQQLETKVKKKTEAYKAVYIPQLGAIKITYLNFAKIFIFCLFTLFMYRFHVHVNNVLSFYTTREI